MVGAFFQGTLGRLSRTWVGPPPPPSPGCSLSGGTLGFGWLEVDSWYG